MFREPKNLIFIFALCIVAPASSILTLKASTPFWISHENFTRMINASLNASVCCNVMLSGDSQHLRDLFTIFTRTYPFEYLLNKRESACVAHLMLLTTVKALTDVMPDVERYHSGVTMLIVIDEEVEHWKRKTLLDVPMYQRAKVNIVTRSELWKLSPNYYVERYFTRVYRWQQMQHEKKLFNLQGRKIRVATDYNPPMSYLRTTYNTTIDGQVVEMFSAGNSGDTEFDGIEVKLLELIADRLHFTWEMRARKGQYRYGRYNGTVWDGGIIEQVIKKEVDVAFSGIWLELPQYVMINLSKPWTQLDVRFLVPRPRPYTSFLVLAKPLSPAVWASIAAALIAQTIYVYTKAWLLPEPPKRFRSLSVTIPELLARLLGLVMSPHYQGYRLLFYTWHMVGVLIVTAYSSSLAASLASSEYEDRIDDTEQFIKKNLTWGREGLPPAFAILKESTDPWTSKLLDHFESEKNDEERHQKIMTGNYAIFGRVVGSMFFPENYVSDDDMKGYRLMRDPVGMVYTSFAVQPYLLPSWEKVLLLLSETGFVDYHIEDVLHRHTSAAHLEVLKEYDSQISPPRVLKLTPLSAAFAIYALGNVLAIVAFIREIRSTRNKKTIAKIFEHSKLFLTVVKINRREFAKIKLFEKIVRK